MKWYLHLNIRVIIFCLAMLTVPVILPLMTGHVNPSRASIPPQSLKLLSRGISVSSWVWDNPEKMLPGLDQKLDFCEKEGISDLYVYVDDYIDIYEMPNGPDKDAKLLSHNEALKTIVSEASKRNIKIYALSGNSNWAFDAHSYIPPIILKHVFDFNKENAPLAISGVKFDIEFYNDEYFIEDTIYNTESYLQLIQDLSNKTNEWNKEFGQNVTLGIALPFWLDSQNEIVPEVAWNGSKKPLTYQVIDILNTTKNADIIIMAYRNFVFGDNGVIDISNNELSYADNTNVKVIIGQETRSVKEKNVSLWGKTKNDIINSLFDIAQNSIIYRSFAGVAIHDLQGYMSIN